jgi:hypothetical protein
LMFALRVAVLSTVNALNVFLLPTLLSIGAQVFLSGLPQHITCECPGQYQDFFKLANTNRKQQATNGSLGYANVLSVTTAVPPHSPPLALTSTAMVPSFSLAAMPQPPASGTLTLRPPLLLPPHTPSFPIPPLPTTLPLCTLPFFHYPFLRGVLLLMLDGSPPSPTSLPSKCKRGSSSASGHGQRPP